MTKSSAEVEREVEASRGELDRTVEALKEKMTPGQLLDEASRAMGGAGRDVMAKFVEQAKENPMPLAVMGLGLAWLMTSSNKQHRAFDEPRSFASTDAAPGLGEKVGDAAHATAEKAKEAFSAVRDKVTGAAVSGRSAAHHLGDVAGSAAQGADHLRHQAQSGFLDLLEREPILIGGLAVVVGAAIGAALPSTNAEDRLVGEARDRLVEKGKDIVEQGLQTAGEVAQSAYGAVKAELDSSGDGPDLSQRVEDATRAGAEAVRRVLHDPSQ